MKKMAIILMIFYSDSSVQYFGQYESKYECQKVVERILENGISGGAEFLCFDYIP